MDPIIEELVKKVEALQIPIYANLMIGLLALLVGLLVRTAIARREEQFKSKLQLELEVRKRRLDAKEDLISREQNIFHRVDKIAKGDSSVEELNKLAMELRSHARDYSGRFPRGEFKNVLELVYLLTDEARNQGAGESLSKDFLETRTNLHEALDRLEELIWS